MGGMLLKTTSLGCVRGVSSNSRRDVNSKVRRTEPADPARAASIVPSRFRRRADGARIGFPLGTVGVVVEVVGGFTRLTLALFDVEVPLAAGQLEQARERREQQQDSDDETLRHRVTAFLNGGRDGSGERAVGRGRGGNISNCFARSVTWAVFDFYRPVGEWAVRACRRGAGGGTMGAWIDNRRCRRRRLR